MKILFFIDSLGIGGKERRFLDLLKCLSKKSFILFEIILLSERIDYELPFTGQTKLHILKRNLRKDLLLLKFVKIINDFKPDIVHGWDAKGAIHFAPFCKLKGIPFINSSISAAPPLLSFFSKRYIATAISYPFSKVILTNSIAGIHSFRVPKSKGLYVHNGFDISRLKLKETEDQIKKRLNIASDKVVGMIASFTSMKDYATFVKAGEMLLEKRRDVTFIALGDGPNLIQIKGSILEKNKSKFLFLGRQTDIESFVNIFDIGVLSSFTEGISNAIMEYMAFGKPVIATEGGGTNELIIDNETGFLVKQQDFIQIAEKLDYLLSNPILAKKMGTRGGERILNFFSIDKMVDETIQIYLNILK